jgi:outer membrane protein TolC
MGNPAFQKDSCSFYEESLGITRNQYRSGTTDQSAVSQAEAQLEGTQAQAIAVGVTRSQLEQAIAVLIGKPPAEFSMHQRRR